MELLHTIHQYQDIALGPRPSSQNSNFINYVVYHLFNYLLNDNDDIRNISTILFKDLLILQREKLMNSLIIKKNDENGKEIILNLWRNGFDILLGDDETQGNSREETAIMIQVFLKYLNL